jgi:dipicolinate synthase subunit B
MAIKAHLRTDRPTLIALASNDAMSRNLKNVGDMLGRKSVYFVPMLQDDPIGKPHSLVAELEMIPRAIEAAMRGEQLRPIFLTSPIA